MAYGFAGHIGIAKETTWGSAQAATDYIEALNENFGMQYDYFQTKNIIGTLAAPDDNKGVKRVTGGIDLHCHPVQAVHFFRGFFHSPYAVASLGTNLWKHTFKTTSGGNDFSALCPNQPYTLEIFRDVTSSNQYIGCVVNALNIGYAPNQDVRCSIQLIGRDESVITKTSPTFPGSPQFPFTFDTASIQLAGAATARIEALNINMSNNFEGIPGLNNSDLISKIRRTDFQVVRISGTLDFTDLAEYLDFRNQTERVLKVSVTKAASFSMIVDIPKFVYTTFPLGIPGKERITIDFEGQARYHSGSGTAIQVDITNCKSDF